MTASALHSQDSSLIWVPRVHALRKLAQADSLNGFKLLVNQLQIDIDTLQKRINRRDEIILQLRRKEANTTAIISEYRSKDAIYEQQRKILMDNVATLNTSLRKARRGLKWTAIGGIFASAIAFIIGTKF